MEEFKRNLEMWRAEWPKDTPDIPCLGCGEAIKVGQSATRILTGPGANPEAREQCLAGRPYEANLIWVHWACATGDVADEQTARRRVQVLERKRLEEGHEALPCVACSGRIVIGQSFALVVIGPGDNEDERVKAFAEEVHEAASFPVHWTCATGDTVPEREDCARCSQPLSEDKACANLKCDLCPGKRTLDEAVPKGGER